MTTYGSILFADHVPTETAEAVRRLEAAGYLEVGKTNLHEFAYGTTSENPHFGTVPNPRAPGRVSPPNEVSFHEAQQAPGNLSGSVAIARSIP